MGSPFELQTISESTVAVIDENLESNAGALILDEFIVAVDATMRPDSARVFRQLLEQQYQRPVKYLCVTHYHGDHVFGLKPFKDVTIFAAVQLGKNLTRRMKTDWTPEALVAWKERDPAVGAWIDEMELFVPPLLFHQRLELAERDKTISFYHAGGHTSCSAYGYYPAEKVLFAGDLIFAEQWPYAGDETCDPEQWMAILRDWLTWDIEKVVPGHGPITDLGEIQKQLTFLEQLKGIVIDTIQTGKGRQDIVMPSMYSLDDSENEQWLWERTQKQWFEYYCQHP